MSTTGQRVAWVALETALTSVFFVALWLAYKWAMLPTGLTAGTTYEGVAIMLVVFAPFYFAVRYWMQPVVARRSRR